MDSIWNKYSNSMDTLGHPLVPGKLELAMYQKAVDWHARQHQGKSLRILVLGVTPMIALGIKWPPGSFLTAVDKTRKMVERVWPGDVEGSRKAVVGNWLDLPFAMDQFDLVIGDGSFSSIEYPSQYKILLDWIAGHLQKPALVVRFFAAPENPEDMDELFELLLQNRISTFHEFKLRYLMALQKDPKIGVQVRNAGDAWKMRGIDIQALAEMTGWDPKAIDSFQYYTTMNDIYTFPTLANVREMLLDYFDNVDVAVADYPASGLCPLVSASRSVNPGT